jgi:hypothetical protein
MEITLVKAARPGGRDRAWLTAGGVARRGPVPSSMTFRTWPRNPCPASLTGCGAELALDPTRLPARRHRPATPERHKQGQIVSGAQPTPGSADGSRRGTARRRRSRNCVTTGGVKAGHPGRGSGLGPRQHDPSLGHLLARVDDETIAVAISGVRNLQQRLDGDAAGRDAQAVLAAATRLLRPGDGEQLTNDQGQGHRRSRSGAADTGIPTAWPHRRLGAQPVCRVLTGSGWQIAPGTY